MAWKIEYTAQATERLETIDYSIASRIERYLDQRIGRSANPRRFGKPLHGELSGYWRYRVGDYRIICDIQDQKVIVLVIDIGHRSKVYGRH